MPVADIPLQYSIATVIPVWPNGQAPAFSRPIGAELMRSCAVEVTTAFRKAVLGSVWGLG